MILWQSGEWQLYDKGQDVADKYTGSPRRYRLYKKTKNRWKVIRKIANEEEINQLVLAMVKSLQK